MAGCFSNPALLAVKVHYSFDRDNQVHCLARWHSMLQIQTMPLDEKTTIGVVDLRTCLQAVSQSSPEILNQQESDYSVYAYDYSEPDVPLVGHGMLSWAMDPQRAPQHQQLVTGRVTRNFLALLNNGSRDTLEVKLKFATVARVVQRTDYPGMESINGTRSPSIPTETASEWNSFLQSNPMLGHAPSNLSAMSSPALAPAQLNHYNSSMCENNRPMDVRSDSHPPQSFRPASMPPAHALAPVTNFPPASRAPSVAPIPPRPQSSADNAPSPAAPQPAEPVPKPRASRPASRSRSKQPTGRPRGRPRKRPLETGNTSAVEEGTDGDDGPQKRRAKVTKTEYSAIAPFGAAPDSLRVAASTAGSLRTMRPVGAGVEGPAANHLQDVPRAPTPVPDAQMFQQQQRRRVLENRARTESITSMDQQGLGRPMVQNLSQDARSPADSTAHSPDHGYLPEDSAGDLGSSPPVPRTAAYIQSSPPASSPVLPTTSMPPLDSGFMSGGLEDMFDEAMLQRLARGQPQDQMLPVQFLPVASKPDPRKNGRAQQQQQQQSSNFPFQEVNPGPPELLPTRSIFNPAGKTKALNRPTPPAAAQPVSKKPATRSFKRSNTAPNPDMSVSEQDPLPQERLDSQADGNGPSQGLAQPYPFQEQAPFSDNMGDSIQPTGNGMENGYAEVFHQEPTPTATMSMPIPERPELEPVLPVLIQPPSRPASRPTSRGTPVPSVPVPMVPASDSVLEPLLTLPRAVASEPPCPPSDFDAPRYSKNLVKKQSIKEKLQSAIERGESPPFCSNCGAIETPTWRKIWTQDHDGDPGFHEFSDKPGCVTMIEVLERDEKERPSKYRLVKKNLGPKEDKKKWTETLLCNPCGIWLGKFKVHRPPDRWDKDAARLNQPRRKREPKGNNSRSKKSRTKSDAQVNPTSEAYFTTDPIGPPDMDFLTENYENGTQSEQQSTNFTEEKHLNLQSSPRQRFPGSTHSGGSGTADSPIAVEEDLGSTRRLLFPSPKREGALRVLGELSLNTAQTTTHAQEAKSAAAGKENNTHPERPGTPVPGDHDGLEQELFGTPPRCPSTPPPMAPTGPFKTPTRPTPSHRPITRSISRSIRSVRSIPKSPSQLFTHHLQQTPTKTPRSASTTGHFLMPSSVSRRRSPRTTNNSNNNNNSAHHLHPHFSFDDANNNNDDDDEHSQLPMGISMQFDSPFTATMHQLLSEANDFIGGSPSRHSLMVLDHQQQQQQLDLNSQQGMAAVDFASFLGGASTTSTTTTTTAADHHHHHHVVMPSSPPLLLRGAGKRRSGGSGGSGGAGDEQFGGVLLQ
ncbi:hypothetical protein C8A00DRAFT_17275 [Chaetomidium leptoderma]|uniref:Ams2/SPT21 N-terminal domain-containing protein n=1 Tax=Chaetomidium leptoderma TaxID=669021 RepID=A0AAN6ZV69_9PEZI|nr:hypothetical protein C8A00DRAFT_17275 [Chaetomidium leptoderma]